MSKVVLDTSAILTQLFDETGADQVEPILEANLGVISSVNYADSPVSWWIKACHLSEAVISVIENLELRFVAQDQ